MAVSGVGPGAGFPTKPFRIFLSFPKGGSSNTTIESMEAGLAERLGQDIVFEIASGGPGGAKAPVTAATAEADGHNLLMATVGNIALLPSIYPGYEIEPLRDLMPITKICDTPDALIARPSLGLNSIVELVELAKTKPGELRFSGINAASIHLLEFHNLMQECDIELQDLTAEHGGANPALDAFEDSKIDLLFMTAPRAVARILAGKASGVAAIGGERISALPDLPTAVEQGVASLPDGSWSGMFAPAGTPTEAIEIIFAAAKATAETDEVRAQATAEGMVVNTSDSPAAFRDYVAAETARMSAAVKKSGMAPV